jgi:hypothetical protein
MRTYDIIKVVRDAIAINNEELDFVKTVTTTSLDKLPGPDDIKQVLPAVLLRSNGIWNINTSNDKSIIYSRYCLFATYVRHFNDEEEHNILNLLYEETDKIANFLMDGRPFENYALDVGEILHTYIPYIEYDSVETEFFRDANLPIVLSNIEFDVHFRTYKRGYDSKI